MKINQIFLSLITLLGCSTGWSANTQPVVEKQKQSFNQGTVEAKLGYFFFVDSTMKSVYEKGGVDVQVSGSYTVWKWLEVYSSVEWTQKSGKSLNGHQHTYYWQLPISLGLKPVFALTDTIGYYFAIGPRYIYAHVKNNSTYVGKRMHANTVGGFLNTGFLFNVYRGCTIDVFGEYSYAKASFHNSKIGAQGIRAQIGGLTFGAGLGYSF